MHDEQIHIAIDGDTLVVGLDHSSGRTNFTINGTAFLAELFRTLQAELAITASGQVALTMDALDDDAAHPSGWLELPRTMPIDALVQAMTEAVLAAPDQDDAAALEEAVGRFDVAKEKMVQALESLRSQD